MRGHVCRLPGPPQVAPELCSSRSCKRAAGLRARHDCSCAVQRCVVAGRRGLVIPGVAWGDSAGDHLPEVSANAEAAIRPGCTAPPTGSQGRRTTGTPTRERGAAQTSRASGALRAGGPTVVRRAVLPDTPAAMGAGLPGDSRDFARVAPKARHMRLGLQQASEQAWPTTAGEGDQGVRTAEGPRESAMGLPPDPRRAGSARASGRFHSLGDLGHCRRRPCASQSRTDMA